MLAGTAPDKILCLTFTKAAAAEMANRINETLAAWATADDADLEDALARLSGARPDREARDAARQPVRPRARRAGRHEDPDDPRLLPVAPAPLSRGGGRAAAFRALEERTARPN